MTERKPSYITEECKRIEAKPKSELTYEELVYLHAHSIARFQLMTHGAFFTLERLHKLSLLLQGQMIRDEEEERLKFKALAETWGIEWP